MEQRASRLSVWELAGFALIVGAFVAAMAVFDVEAQSWTSFTLLAAALVVLLGYRALLKRRRA